MKWRDPEEARSRLYEVVQTQAGCFTSRQALGAGYSWRLQHYHAARGHWLRIERGLYRLREFPSSPHEDLVRWCLWSRGKAVVSHDTAAAVHELGDVMPARIHLTVPPGFRKAIPPSIALHRARLGEDEVIQGDGFRITSPLRTIIDLLLFGMESDRLAAIVRDAIERGAVRRPALDAGISKLDMAQRDRARRVLALAVEKFRAI